MAALAGEGGPPPGGPPEDEGAVPDMGSELDILDEIRVAMLAYLDHDGVDDIERAEMTKALQTVQKLLAKNQQEEEAATGTTPAMKGMRRAIGG